MVKVIRIIFDLIANQGWSYYKVPEKLNAMGIPTRFKNTLQTASVVRIF